LSRIYQYDYVVLHHYDGQNMLFRVPRTHLLHNGSYIKGKDVYVVLKLESDYVVVKGISLQKPDQGIIIHATIAESYPDYLVLSYEVDQAYNQILQTTKQKLLTINKKTHQIVDVKIMQE
jgi:hypothetical protein